VKRKFSVERKREGIIYAAIAQLVERIHGGPQALPIDREIFR